MGRPGLAGREAGERRQDRLGEALREDSPGRLLGWARPAEPLAQWGMEDVSFGDSHGRTGRHGYPEAGAGAGFDALCAHLDDGILEYVRPAWFGGHSQLRRLRD